MYYNRPLGKKELGEFMNKALGHLPSGSNTVTSRSKVENHSCRKESISSLLENNVNPLHVSQLSGHKNTDSLNSYYMYVASQAGATTKYVKYNKSEAKFAILFNGNKCHY